MKRGMPAPPHDELALLYPRFSLPEVGRYYNVHKSIVRRWLTERGIPITASSGREQPLTHPWKRAASYESRNSL